MPAARSTFDEFVDRRGTNSLKWAAAARFLTPDQVAADPLPMWVADMDFRAPQVVRDALAEAVEHGVFGYPAGPTDGYLAAVTGWQARRHGWRVAPEWVVPTAGVIAALKTAVQAFTRPGESVLVQPPVYRHFLDDVRLNGRRLALAPLERVTEGYRFDPTSFEAAIAPDTTLFILSNPHNPTGNVWSADELRAMGEICDRHGVLVVSDEIHQDLVLDPAVRHTPFASLDLPAAATSITCTAASKTFNLPGLQVANTVIADDRLRARFARQYERNVYPTVNLLGMVATQAAYESGDAWLDELVPYVRANHALLAERLAPVAGDVQVLPAASLYLAWLDFRGLGLAPTALEDFLLTRGRVWLDPGPKFGKAGHGYMRLNLGCPRSTVSEAADRLVAALQHR